MEIKKVLLHQFIFEKITHKDNFDQHIFLVPDRLLFRWNWSCTTILNVTTNFWSSTFPRHHRVFVFWMNASAADDDSIVLCFMLCRVFMLYDYARSNLLWAIEWSRIVSREKRNLLDIISFLFPGISVNQNRSLVK